MSARRPIDKSQRTQACGSSGRIGAIAPQPRLRVGADLRHVDAGCYLPRRRARRRRERECVAAAPAHSGRAESLFVRRPHALLRRCVDASSSPACRREACRRADRLPFLTDADAGARSALIEPAAEQRAPASTEPCLIASAVCSLCSASARAQGSGEEARRLPSLPLEPGPFYDTSTLLRDTPRDPRCSGPELAVPGDTPAFHAPLADAKALVKASPRPPPPPEPPRRGEPQRRLAPRRHRARWPPCRAHSGPARGPRRLGVDAPAAALRPSSTM